MATVMNIIVSNLFFPSPYILYTDVRVILLKFSLNHDSILFSFKSQLFHHLKKEKKNTQSLPYNIQDSLLLYLYHPLPTSTYHCPPTLTKLALSTLDSLLFPGKDVHLHISDPLLLIPLAFSLSQDA